MPWPQYLDDQNFLRDVIESAQNTRANARTGEKNEFMTQLRKVFSPVDRLNTRLKSLGDAPSDGQIFAVRLELEMLSPRIAYLCARASKGGPHPLDQVWGGGSFKFVDTVTGWLKIFFREPLTKENLSEVRSRFEKFKLAMEAMVAFATKAKLEETPYSQQQQNPSSGQSQHRQPFKPQR